MWYKHIAGRFFGLVTKHACDRRTDRRTDRITTPKTALAQLRRTVKIGSICLYHGQHAIGDLRYFLAPCDNYGTLIGTRRCALCVNTLATPSCCWAWPVATPSGRQPGQHGFRLETPCVATAQQSVSSAMQAVVATTTNPFSQEKCARLWLVIIIITINISISLYFCFICRI